MMMMPSKQHGLKVPGNNLRGNISNRKVLPQCQRSPVMEFIFNGGYFLVLPLILDQLQTFSYLHCNIVCCLTIEFIVSVFHKMNKSFDIPVPDIQTTYTPFIARNNLSLSKCVFFSARKLRSRITCGTNKTSFPKSVAVVKEKCFFHNQQL